MPSIGGIAVLTPQAGTTISQAVDTTVGKQIIAWTAAQNATLNLTGTPLDGQELYVIITNDGTARTITFGTGMSAKGTILGTINKKTVVQFVAYGGTFLEIVRNIGL